MNKNIDSILVWLQVQGVEYGLRILGAIAILLIGLWVAKLLANLLRKVLEARKLDPMIVTFIYNIAKGALIAFVIVAAVQKLGIQTASFIAVVGAIGLAMSLALQGTLGNFASGVIMLVLRPFNKGDYIEGGGTSGSVEHIDIFATILNSPDNKRIIVPNGKLMNDVIVNYSTLATRRLDFTFGCSYSDDIPKVKTVLTRIASEDARFLKDPEPQVLVSELADSSVNLILRTWVKKEDYWPLTFETIEKVKLTFDQEGISIPFPQQDVHLTRN